MSERGYKIRNKKEAHFVTFTVVNWIDVFTRKQYRDIVVDSMIYCQKNKGLLVHAWCIMSNHMHLIASAVDENLSDILRDLKKFTSKQIIAAIEKNEHESRKEWVLELFKRNANHVSHNKNYPRLTGRAGVLETGKSTQRMLQPCLYRSKAELYSQQSSRSRTCQKT